MLLRKMYSLLPLHSVTEGGRWRLVVRNYRATQTLQYLILTNIMGLAINDDDSGREGYDVVVLVVTAVVVIMIVIVIATVAGVVILIDEVEIKAVMMVGNKTYYGSN